jgi:hypothetical protein
MDVARYDLIETVYHANDGFFEVLIAQPQAAEQRSMSYALWAAFDFITFHFCPPFQEYKVLAFRLK